MSENLTPKLNMPPFQTILDSLPSTDMATVQGGWVQGATDQAKGSNVLDYYTRYVAVGGSIQKAINELNALGGGTVYLASGTHTLTESLVGYSKVSLIGVGVDQTILECGGNAYGISYVGTAGAQKTNFVLKDFTLQNSNNAAGITIGYADFWTMENVKSTSCDQGGISVDQCRSFRVYNVTASSNTGNGFIITSGTDRRTDRFSFLNCTASSNGVSGFIFTPTTNVLERFSMITCDATSNISDGFNFNDVINGTLLRDFSIIGCTADSNFSIGFNVSASRAKFLGCLSIANASHGFRDLLNSNIYIGNSTPSNTGLNFSLGASNGAMIGNLVSTLAQQPSSEITTNTSNSAYENQGNLGDSPTTEKKIFVMKHTSGSQINTGEVVVFKSVASGEEVTTTTTAGDNKVFGMSLGTTGDNEWRPVQTRGFTSFLKVDGTTDIAIGDYLSCFTTAGIAQKASAGQMVFAIALEAYTNNDSNGVIDALLISPRLI